MVYDNTQPTSFHFPTLRSDETFQKDVLPFMVFKENGPQTQDPHAHEYIQMWYVLNGSCHHHFNGKDFTMEKGSLFILPPHTLHYITADDSPENELIACEFSESFINQNAGTSEQNTLFNMTYLEPILIDYNLIKPSISFTGEAADTIEKLLNELYYEYQKQDAFFSMLIKANILKLFALIAREYEKNLTAERDELFKKYRNAIDDALDYINNHYTDKIYLEDICRIALMSPSSFSYIFKQITGHTFTEYLLYMRVLKSRTMLEDSGYSIADISHECGFNNTEYFHRAFKKVTGISPGQYRKICKNNL